MEIFLIYLFLWIGICCLVAFLFYIKAKLFKEDSKIAKAKYKAVYISSMAGAIIGIWPFIIVTLLFAFISDFLFPNLEIDSDNYLFGWIDIKVSLVVIYLACVFVTGIDWLLSQKKIIIKEDEDF